MTNNKIEVHKRGRKEWGKISFNNFEAQMKYIRVMNVSVKRMKTEKEWGQGSKELGNSKSIVIHTK